MIITAETKKQEKLQEDLYQACRITDISAVKKAIQKGADISRDNYLAYEKGKDNLRICLLLVDNGLDIHIDKNHILLQAVENNELKIVKKIISLPTFDLKNINDQIIPAAAELPTSKIFYYLQKNHFDIHTDNNRGFDSACLNRNHDIIDTYINSNKLTIEHYTNGFFKAIHIGDLEIVKLTLSKGVNPMTDQGYAFFNATSQGHNTIIKHLLSIIPKNEYILNNCIETAARNANLDIIKHLHTLGADINIAEKHCNSKIKQDFIYYKKCITEKEILLQTIKKPTTHTVKQKL